MIGPSAAFLADGPPPSGDSQAVISSDGQGIAVQPEPIVGSGTGQVCVPGSIGPSRGCQQIFCSLPPPLYPGCNNLHLHRPFPSYPSFVVSFLFSFPRPFFSLVSCVCLCRGKEAVSECYCLAVCVVFLCVLLHSFLFYYIFLPWRLIWAPIHSLLFPTYYYSNYNILSSPPSDPVV